MVENILEKIFQDFDVLFLNENNCRYIAFQKPNYSKIITIDYYQDENEKNNNEYFSICFDHSIFIINITYLPTLKYFLAIMQIR